MLDNEIMSRLSAILELFNEKIKTFVNDLMVMRVFYFFINAAANIIILPKSIRHNGIMTSIKHFAYK